ncbi:hypothetical protein V7128_26800 [Neobacillus vireti]|uniref:hypothetical protein n=1 Tax=Neobacillus vireti TaxID=220686 RepID=UPI003000601D
MKDDVVGAVVLLLFIFHNLMNGRWYKVILKGSHHLRRKLQIAINLLFLVTMAVHVGFSWFMIINSVRRKTGISGTSRIRTIGLRILAVLIVAYGVHASFKREMGSKLFIYNPFGNWFKDHSTVVFLIDYLSIMGIYICGTHYALKFIQKQETRAGQTI